MNPNTQPPTRDDLADRIMDLALAEKVGGKGPPDLSQQILSRAQEPVSLPEPRRAAEPAPARRSYVPLAVGGCLLCLAALAAVLVQPDLTTNALQGVAANRKPLTDDQKQQRLVDLVERFNAAIDDQHFAQAQALAREAQQLAPQSAVVETMLYKSEFLRRIAAGESVEDLSTNAMWSADEQEASEGRLLREFEDNESRFLGSVENAKRIINQKISGEVAEGLIKARRRVKVAPEEAKRDLKLLLDNVERAVDLDPKVRDKLRDHLEPALREATRREIEFAEKRADNEVARAAALERQLLPSEEALSFPVADRVVALRQQLDSVRSLRSPRGIVLLTDGASSMDSSQEYAALTSRYSKMRTKSRGKGLHFAGQTAGATLDDSAPIVYPDRRTWEELTLRRKKYASADQRLAGPKVTVFNGQQQTTYSLKMMVTPRIILANESESMPQVRDLRPLDLSAKGSAETKILAALDDPTTLEFIETPLKDVVDYLKDLHGIEIQLDEKAAATLGVNGETPVTRNLKGTNLDSALRMLLKDVGLSYTVKDEVLQITTPQQALPSPEALAKLRSDVVLVNQDYDDDDPALYLALKLKGQVTEVSPKNSKLVKVSLGDDDGLRVGRVLEVYRDGKPLGRSIVVETTADEAIARVMAAGDFVALIPGDIIVTLNNADNVGPEPEPAGDKFDLLPENSFELVGKAPLSTFSIDVDTASYSKVRQFLLHAGQLPPAEAVRLEEFINYFPYSYAPPADERPFAAHVETAACPWNAKHRLVRVGLKGKVIETEKRPPCNLVFLVDVSGSMNEPNKLPLVIQSLKLLAAELTEKDRVSIVVYAGAAGLVLPPTPGDERAKIFGALMQLEAGGSTDGGAGIELAYKLAQENLIDGGANRVILCTDGDFNVGTTSTGQLVDLAKEKAQHGVFLSVLGYGMGNHNDEMLEAVSNKANGNYAFIDSLNEARKVLVRQINGTLVTIAKDVKIQVEFNPKQVGSYRLLGYEDRMLAAEDFNNDKKDAGEIGGGHTVTALYEIVPAGAEEKPAEKEPAKKAETPKDDSDNAEKNDGEKKDIDELRYQPPGKPAPVELAGELLTLKLRYKEPDGDTSTKIEFPVKDSGQAFAKSSPDFQFAAAVASFGMLLRHSQHKGDGNFAAVLEIATATKGEDPHGYRAEFLELVKKAAELTKAK